MIKIDKRTLLVGLDLGNEFTQLSCYDEALFEPVSISAKESEDAFLIPTALYMQKETRQWYFGTDAYDKAAEQLDSVIDDILGKVAKGEKVILDESEIESTEILSKFLSRVLNLLKWKYQDNTIKQLVVTVKEMDEILINGIYNALESLGIDNERAKVIRHDESYRYYALSQKKELWLNDVGLFDYNEDGLSFYHLAINRRTSPTTVGIEKLDMSSELSYSMKEQCLERGELNFIFDNLSRKALHKKIISTIYVTGKGFEGQWANKVLEGLCVGRRVFFGQNIYSVGACYGAREISGVGRLEDFLFLDEDMVLVDISVKIYKDTRFCSYYLCKAGTPWQEVKEEIEVIPDNVTELEVLVTNIMEQTQKTHFMRIDAIDGRPPKTTNLGISIRFLDNKTCVLQVKDNGFGNLFPSTNRVWEKELHL